MITYDAVVEKLKTIYDPEIPVDIFELGLIYDVKVIGNSVYIVMTLTTATCPAAAFLPEEVKAVVAELKPVQAIHVDVVYEPRWTTDRMSQEAKAQLGFA